MIVVADKKLYKALTAIAGLAKAIGEGGLDVLHEGKIDPSSIDAEDADVIIQYAIFGEVVYG